MLKRKETESVSVEQPQNQAIMTYYVVRYISTYEATHNGIIFFGNKENCENIIDLMNDLDKENRYQFLEQYIQVDSPIKRAKIHWFIQFMEDGLSRVILAEEYNESLDAEDIDDDDDDDFGVDEGIVSLKSLYNYMLKNPNEFDFILDSSDSDSDSDSSNEEEKKLESTEEDESVIAEKVVNFIKSKVPDPAKDKKAFKKWMREHEIHTQTDDAKTNTLYFKVIKGLSGIRDKKGLINLLREYKLEGLCDFESE
jgi:hypothetical protein